MPEKSQIRVFSDNKISSRKTFWSIRDIIPTWDWSCLGILNISNILIIYYEEDWKLPESVILKFFLHMNKVESHL